MSVLRRRGPAFGIALGFVMGMLIAGLVFPLLFGQRRLDVSGGSPLGGELASASPGPRGDDKIGSSNETQIAPIGTGRSAGGPGTSRTSARPPGIKLRATDRGVTADSIRIGVVIGDPGGAAGVGVNLSTFPTEREERAYKAFIDDVNEHGGVLGRKIEPVYRLIDILSEEDAAAACREMTQDHKVFAVLNFYGVEELCYTKSHATPLFKGQARKEKIDVSKGYLSTPGQSSLRAAENMAWELHRMGAVNGKKIGILGGSGGATADSSPGDVKGVIDVFQALGDNVAHVSYLSEDFQTAQSQIPGEVLEMKRKGIDVVTLLTQLVHNVAFVQNAEAQRFLPQYAVNDWEANGTDTAAQGMPRSYDGTIAITSLRDGEWRTHLPEGAADRACLKTYTKSSGEEIAHSADDARLAVGSVCEAVYRFRDSAILAGPNLTRNRLVAGVQALGVRPIPFTGGGSYTPGKLDGADYVRTKRFHYDCGCFMVTEDFRKSRF